MLKYIGQQGKSGFVPLVPVEMGLNGIQRTLYHSISEFHEQMSLKRGFLQVLREEHAELLKKCYKNMEEAQYFSVHALAEAYPILAYFVQQDFKLFIGKRYATIGTVDRPLYVVKVGEADKLKIGIYRVAPVMLACENDG